MLKLFFFTLLFIGITQFSFAQYDPSEIGSEEFLKETQKLEQGNSELSMLWWIPIEFWEISLAKDKSMTDFQKDELYKALKPYTIFAVVHGDIGTYGSVTYDSYDSIFNSIVLKDKFGKKHRPLKMEELNDETEMLLTIMKPMLKNMMGDLGLNMHFFVFNDHDKNGRIFDPSKSGSMELDYLDVNWDFQTPISVLLPKKECPKDHKKMNGSWKYCPFHGDELIPVKD